MTCPRNHDNKRKPLFRYRLVSRTSFVTSTNIFCITILLDQALSDSYTGENIDVNVYTATIPPTTVPTAWFVKTLPDILSNRAWGHAKQPPTSFPGSTPLSRWRLRTEKKKDEEKINARAECGVWWPRTANKKFAYFCGINFSFY